MSKLVQNMKGLLLTKEELNKKQVALYLTQNQIDRLDNAVNLLAPYSNGKVTKNTLISLAIEDMLDKVPQVMEEYTKEMKNQEDDNFDLIVCPSQISGVDFIKKHNYWEFVKIDANKIKYLKYWALYVGTPESSIKYWAKIEHLKEVQIGNQKKYRIFLGKIHELQPSIPLNNLSSLKARSTHYTTLAKLKAAKEYADIL